MTPKQLLQYRQRLPLEIKVRMTEERIKHYYKKLRANVYISFSGGKDSTVLLHIARRLYKNITVVFVDTGLEYPEIRSFVRTIDGVVWIKPKLNFQEVLTKYGYPIISKENAQKIDEIRNTKSEKLLNKRLYGDEKGNGKLPEKWMYMIDAPFKISSKCCNALKKSPLKSYENKSGLSPIVATMASDSDGRETSYLKKGCNSFSTKRNMSTPMGFWVEQDIWDYLEKYNVAYSTIYTKGYTRTGCMFCMFGLHLDKINRFEIMKKTHPKQYNYCMNKLECKRVIDYYIK